jgi:hypothetical protein
MDVAMGTGRLVQIEVDKTNTRKQAFCSRQIPIVIQFTAITHLPNSPKAIRLNISRFYVNRFEYCTSSFGSEVLLVFLTCVFCVHILSDEPSLHGLNMTDRLVNTRI